MTVYIGIDPGFTGAVAFLWPDKNKIEVFDMPTYKNTKGKTELNLYELHDILTPETDEPHTCMIEQVAAMRGQGVSSMFRFGQSYGATQMAVAAHKIPMQFVTPAKWKAYFGLSRDKGVSRSIASQRFPKIADMFSRQKDDGRAEAALLALYAKVTA
jgi:crossover junction endodeoxyribonuclease RuvC